MKIIIPSSGRADCVTTNIENQILVVPENEFEEYKKINDCEVIPHPFLFNLARKRNWILDYFKNDDVFMIDDDVLNFVNLSSTLPRKKRNLNKKQSYEAIKDTYLLSKELGLFLYGFNNSPVPVQFNGLKPYELSVMGCGGAYGINAGGNLRFCESTTACDSHYITLLNAFIHGQNLVNNLFGLEFKPTFKSNGGQANKRTLASEKKDTLFLRKQFGEIVQLRKTSRNKANHKYQRSLIFSKAL